MLEDWTYVENWTNINAICGAQVFLRLHLVLFSFKCMDTSRVLKLLITVILGMGGCYGR